MNNMKPATNPQSETPIPSRHKSILVGALFLLLAVGLWWMLRTEPVSNGQTQVETKVKPPARFLVEHGRMSRTDRPTAASELTSKSTLTNIQYVFDSNKASGTNRFLVGTKWDENYREMSDSPSGREMWITDEFGNERLVHESVFRARFSPDGSKVAFTTSDCVLHVETLKGDQLASVEKAFDPYWRQDGKEILFVKVPAEVELWPAEVMNLATLDYNTGETKLLTEGAYDDCLPSFSSSGKWVLFVSGARSGWASFYILPASGGDPVQLTNRDSGIPVPYDRMHWSADGRWFIYDAKDGDTEETWALEITENGQLKGAKKLADALDPQIADDGSIVSLRKTGDVTEPIVSRLPGS